MHNENSRLSHSSLRGRGYTGQDGKRWGRTWSWEGRTGFYSLPWEAHQQAQCGTVCPQLHHSCPRYPSLSLDSPPGGPLPPASSPHSPSSAGENLVKHKCSYHFPSKTFNVSPLSSDQRPKPWPQPPRPSSLPLSPPPTLLLLQASQAPCQAL